VKECSRGKLKGKARKVQLSYTLFLSIVLSLSSWIQNIVVVVEFWRLLCYLRCDLE
jgi:hypothetical protein